MREDSTPMLLVKNQDQLTKKSKATDELIESLIFAIPEASQPEKGRMYNMAWKMVSAEGAYKDEQRHLLQARLNAAKLKDDRPTLPQKMLEDFEADLKKDNAAAPGYGVIQGKEWEGEVLVVGSLVKEPKTWRTLIRVRNIDTDTYHLILPAIDSEKAFIVNKTMIPFELTEGQRFHAKANLDAECVSELHLSDFEDK